MAIFHGNAIPSAVSAYDIDNSCRFDAASSAYMHWTPSGAGDSTEFTISFWYKIASVGSSVTRRTLFSAGTVSLNEFVIGQGFNGSGDQINVQMYISGSGNAEIATNRLHRDPSGWYHIVVAIDTSEGAAADKCKLYINGTLETSFATDQRSSMGASQIVNSAVSHRIGQFARVGGHYHDGYISEFHSVDGTALTADSFGKRGDYGEWKPIEYSGSHGTNGFYLDFSNATSYTTGDRSSDITVTHDIPMYRGTPADWVQGRAPSWSPATALTNLTAVAGKYIRFAFASARTYTGHRFYNQNNGAENLATWKWQGSNTAGGASGYVDISDSFVLANNTTPEIIPFTLSGVLNSTAYLYYQLLGVSGNADQENVYEMEFATGSGSLGDDASGNGNNFTATNISGSDQMLDTPTNNFCTFNSLDDSITNKGTFSEGNLQCIGVSGGHYQGGQVGTMHTSNKIYYEICFEAAGSEYSFFGIAPDDYNPSSISGTASNWPRPGKSTSPIDPAHGVSADLSSSSSGYATIYYDGGSTASAETPYNAGDIFMVAFDPATGKFWWGENGTWAGSGNPATGANPAVTLTNLNHTWTIAVGVYNNSNTIILNCGQDGTFAGNKTAGGNADDNGYGNFFYDVPAGFLALCSKNLTDCAVTPSEHFNTVLYTGDGAGSKAITGVGFQPDFTWVKSRTTTHSHGLFDAVRGVTKRLGSDNTGLEETVTNSLTAFGADGFTVGDHSAINTNTNTHVAWNWKANGAGSANNDGQINTTSTSANVAAGFSISLYAGNASGVQTVGHGLSQAPQLVIIKDQDGGGAWQAWGGGTTGSDWTDAMYLNDTNAAADYADWWNDTAPTSSVVTLGGNGYNNGSGDNFIMYCFHSVEGYSKVGSYTGNGNVDGAFVYTGFTPAFVMMKRIEASGKNWLMYDRARDPVNDGAFRRLNANGTDVEDGGPEMDWQSNGFKTKTTNSEMNYNGGSFLYIAFASVPFKNSNAQ